MNLCLAQRDLAIQMAPRLQAGLLSEEAWKIAILAASFCGDMETPPGVIKEAADQEGVSMTLLVAPSSEIPQEVRDHVLAGKVAFAWLMDDAETGKRFWCHLHTHDGKSIEGAFYLSGNSGYAVCCHVDHGTTGHYLLVDEVFVPAVQAHIPPSRN